MITSELALTKAFIDLFIAEDVYETPDLSREFAALTLDLDNEEAEAIPQALRNASAALAGELGRWRAIGDIAVRFDLHELIDVLLDGFTRQTDPHQLANVASLAANPAVSAETRQRVEDVRDQMGIQDSVDRLIQIRLGNTSPISDLEHALDIQSWPGRHSMKELVRASPLVYVSEKDAPAAPMWRVCAALVEAGARVRRIPASTISLKDPTWASSDYPTVVWGGNGIAQWRRISGSESVKTIQAPNELRQPVVLTRLIGRIDALLPSGVSLQHRDASQTTIRQTFSPEVLGEGAFDSLEMAYLGGSSRSTLSRLTKETAALQPAGDRQHHWAFDQLITLRLIQAFKSRNARFRASGTLTGKLREIAAANVVSEIAIDSMGKMFRSTDDGYETLEGDQGAFGTIITVDEAFRPFKIGGGSVVPDLLRPSSMTAVDPIVLAGTPTIRSRRVPVRSLAETMTRGMATVRSAYPELNAAEIVDGVKVANAILAIGA